MVPNEALGRREFVGGAILLPVGLALSAAASSHSFADPDDMYAALGGEPDSVLSIGVATIRVVFADGAGGLAREPVLRWIREAAAAVTAYFGRFPVDEYGLLVIAQSGDSVGHGTTFGYAGAATRIHVGTSASEAALARDWVLVHEMVHTALPDVPRRAFWLLEGNATYVEPVARLAAGQISKIDFWRDVIDGLPKGKPGIADTGMDGTTAWGRLYWGGATFWLLAEIAIYRATAGNRSLRDALRRINRESGGNRADWSPEQMMLAGDEATGTKSLSLLYANFAANRVDTDLDRLFRELGLVDSKAGSLRFDDQAPLAALRERIGTASG